MNTGSGAAPVARVNLASRCARRPFGLAAFAEATAARSGIDPRARPSLMAGKRIEASIRFDAKRSGMDVGALDQQPLGAEVSEGQPFEQFGLVGVAGV